MKILIVLFFILPGFWSYAQNCTNFIAESEIQKAINMEPGAGAKRCGGADPCVCFDGVKWDEVSYVDIEIDDYSRPVYKTPYNVESCATNRACAERTADESFCEAGDSGFWREVPGGKEAYCTKLLRYQKKTVKQLQEDSTKKAAKVAETAKKVAEKAQLDQRLATAKEQTKGCLGISESATNAELARCVKELSLRVLRSDLTKKDLEDAGVLSR